MNGYEKLKQAVMRDCREHNACDCFNENGCDKENQSIGKYGDDGYKHCFHAYCDKFKWVIERARHYGEKLNIPWEEILDSWEEDRDYWYMNYYQESNQPLIDSDSVYVFESAEEMRSKVGNEFICPCCKGISTNPYECNSGKKTNGKICDWKSYGFFQFDLAFIYCKKERKSEKIFKPRKFVEQS